MININKLSDQIKDSFRAGQYMAFKISDMKELNPKKMPVEFSITNVEAIPQKIVVFTQTEIVEDGKEIVGWRYITAKKNKLLIINE